MASLQKQVEESVQAVARRALKVLVLEDRLEDFDLLMRELKRTGLSIRAQRAETESEYLSHLQDGPDIILSDYNLSLGFNALRALELLQEAALDIPLVVLSGVVSEEIMVECMRRGASDYLLKDRLMRLGPAVSRALQERELRAQKRQAELETVRAWATAEARAAMAVELVQLNNELQEVNRLLKKTQAHMVQTEKMASLGQLVAGIAHEINNPLAFISNNLFLVESGLDRIAPEVQPHMSEPSLRKLRKVRGRLAEMKEGLDRVKELVLSLRTFSRLDEGEFKAIDVGESIDSVLLFLQHKTNGRIQVEKQYGPERTLYCCGGRLNQLLMNLISNAVDAIVGKGTIVITMGQTDDVFSISVRDTGAGIPEAIRSSIFNPFFTTKPVGQGTGLGLAISYGIVQDHHGSIEVGSQEGVGSEFSVRIPRDLEARRRE